jgi:hypothetical protein
VLPGQVRVCTPSVCVAEDSSCVSSAAWLTLGLAAEVMMPGTITSLPTRADCRVQQESRVVVSFRQPVFPELG